MQYSTTSPLLVGQGTSLTNYQSATTNSRVSLPSSILSDYESDENTYSMDDMSSSSRESSVMRKNQSAPDDKHRRKKQKQTRAAVGRVGLEVLAGLLVAIISGVILFHYQKWQTKRMWEALLSELKDIAPPKAGSVNQLASSLSPLRTKLLPPAAQ